MNQLIITGRMTKDIELKYSSNGKAIGRFTIAVEREFKKEGQQEADFINCVAFDKKAEVIANFVKKGHKLGVIGRIQTNTFDKQDGTKGYSTDVMVDKIEFLQPKGNDGQAPKGNEPIPDDYFGATPVDDGQDIPF